MLHETIYKYRVNAARQYIVELHEALRMGWRYYYNNLELKYYKDNCTYINAMVLLHPWLFDMYPATLELRGSRNFSRNELKAIDKCAAEHLWGYSCSYEHYELAADHVFPYSLGGVSTTENMLYLCKFHNAMKSNDIHF